MTKFRGKLPKRSLPSIVVSRPLVVVDLGRVGDGEGEI